MPPKRAPAKAQKPPAQAPEKAVVRKAEPPVKTQEPAGALVPFSSKGRGLGVSTRELVLWAKEHGGELILARNITGPEKLRLKADALSGAVRAPFNFDELFKIAESQLDEHLSQIERLQDHRFFYDDMVEYINSRIEKAQGRKKLLDNPVFVAAAIGARIHNIYYLAASWKQVLLLLQELKRLVPNFHHNELNSYFKRKDPTFRDRFVLLYRMMVVLVGVNQKNLALAAAASPHYGHYFMTVQAAWMAFRREEAMGAMKSLIDTIVMELIFPESQYPMHILFTCLQESLDAAPKETKRFNQRMYDAVGDLGEAVRVLDMIESTLVGEWANYRDSVPPYTPAFEAYIDAEYFSLKASREMGPLQNLVNPLGKAKDRGTLNKLWKTVNLVYTQISGFDIDKAWQLQDDRNPTPQWSFIFSKQYFEDSASEFSQSEDEDAVRGALVLHKDRKKIAKTKKTQGAGAGTVLAGASKGGAVVKHKSNAPKKPSRKITQGEKGNRSGDESDEDIPDLAYASASTDLDDGSDDDASGDDLLADTSDVESEYNSEEMAELSRMFTQMMNEAGEEDIMSMLSQSDGDDEAAPEVFGPTRPPGMKPNEKDKSGKKPKSKNPFVKLVKQFAGRLFSLDETLNSEQPRRPDPSAVKQEQSKAAEAAAQKKAPTPQQQSKPAVAKPAQQPKAGLSPGLQATKEEYDSDKDMPPLEPISTYTRTRTKPAAAAPSKSKPTIEEVEDEDEKISKNKKKRMRKKAKEDTNAIPIVASPPPTATPLSPKPAAAAAVPASPARKKGSKAAPDSPATNTADYQSAYSVSSLSLHQPQAQSARSYLAEQGILDPKPKPKKRATEPTIAEAKEPPTKEGFSKTMGNIFRSKPKEAEKVEEKAAEARTSVPFSLGKRVKNAMSNLFSGEAKTMKWDVFVKAMKAMGFTYHPGTAGSSVRFDPPNSGDQPITFHKPHPDPTLQPNMLKQFRKRLERNYGWTAENFKKFENAAVEEEVD